VGLPSQKPSFQDGRRRYWERLAGTALGARHVGDTAVGTVRGMLVTDLHHCLDLPEDTPGPAGRLAQQLGTIVRAATRRAMPASRG
jgi:hypothetical protein